MIIILKRFSHKGISIDGDIYIDGQRICSTVENARTAVPAGRYEVKLLKCNQYMRKMPLLLTSPVTAEDVEQFKQNKCKRCRRTHYVTGNDVMPHYCPMLKPGNGVNGHDDGSIILGTMICPGCLKNSRQAYAPLYERMRKAIGRHHNVIVIIIDETK